MPDCNYYELYYDKLIVICEISKLTRKFESIFGGLMTLLVNLGHFDIRARF